jgi:hypothetical protein
MKKRLSWTLLIIIFGFTLITPIGMTIGTKHHLTSNCDHTYTFDVEHGNYWSTYTLYTSVPPSLYDYYHSETHYVSGERDYAKFVTPDAVKTIAENIRKFAPNSLNTDEEFANDVLTLVHQIPYAVSARKYPVETIVDNSGDCDVLSFLAASIMKAGSLDVVLLIYRDLPGSHMNVGVYLPFQPLYATSDVEPVGFKYKNKTYWVAECTPSGNWKVGQQPESFAHVKPTIISLENREESSPAFISSSLNSPLIPSSISVTLSLENLSATEKERPLTISGSISPAYSGKKVVMYVSQDRSSSKVFQTDTDDLGNYSFTWNVTSTGTYYIRTSLITFSNYAASDSDLITFFAGSYPPSVGGNRSNDEGSVDPDGVVAFPDNMGYKSLSSRSVKEFLKSNLEGTSVSLSGEFIVLKSGQTMTNSKQTRTIPEKVEEITVWRRRKTMLTMTERTVTVQGSEQASNQFGFILQNNNGNYSANVRLLNDSEIAQIEKRFSENNSTFMNASTSIRENRWYNVVAKVSKSEITAELRGENGTLLKDLAVKGEATGSSEYGILISCTPPNFIAFKNLKVECLDQPPNQSVSSIQLPERRLELLSSYVILLMLLGIVGVTITYLEKKGKKVQARAHPVT